MALLGGRLPWHAHLARTCRVWSQAVRFGWKTLPSTQGGLMRGARLLSGAGSCTEAARERSLVAPRNTIYALSSGRGKAGVAVIRITGPETNVALSSLIRGRWGDGLAMPPRPVAQRRCVPLSRTPAQAPADGGQNTFSSRFWRPS